MNTKRCPHCGLIKPLSEFQRCRWMVDGRQTWCRDCMNEKKRSYSHPQGKEHASLASVPTARQAIISASYSIWRESPKCAFCTHRYMETFKRLMPWVKARVNFPKSAKI